MATELTLPRAKPWRQRLIARLETPLIQNCLIAPIRTVRMEIAENTGPSADAAGKPAVPGRSP